MLSNEKIIKAIRDKEIEISVAWKFENGKIDLYKTEQNLLDSPMKDNLYSDRIKLTMGPIIKILDNKAINPQYRFKAIYNCYDLRKSDNKYVINPGESIIVLTNEKIKLNGKYACLVVPRISLSDVGIVVTTAYVDPYYYGLMRLHLSNLSDRPYELNVLEAIAQCFFFELSEEVSDVFKEQFPTKSVFFGQTWYGILETDRNPFPTKKESVFVDRFSNLKYQLNILWSFVKKHSLILWLITNIAVIICGLSAFKQKFAEYTTTIEQIQNNLNPIASEIVINPGEMYGEKEITIDYEKSDIIAILCNDEEIHYKILSGDVENKTKVVFSYSLSSAPLDKYEINFTYVIVRRIK